MRFEIGEGDETKEPPDVLLLRNPKPQWRETTLRKHAQEMRRIAQTAVLTRSQRRRCLLNAERAEKLIDEKRLVG